MHLPKSGIQTLPGLVFETLPKRLGPARHLGYPTGQTSKLAPPRLSWNNSYQWIGLRENLQETIDFPIKYGAFL